MKHILLLISVVALLTTTGCIFPGHRGGGEYNEHGEYYGHTQYSNYSEPGVDVRIHAQ